MSSSPKWFLLRRVVVVFQSYTHVKFYIAPATEGWLSMTANHYSVIGLIVFRPGRGKDNQEKGFDLK